MTELERSLMFALLEIERISTLETSRIMGRIRRRTADALADAREISQRTYEKTLSQTKEKQP